MLGGSHSDGSQHGCRKLSTQIPRLSTLNVGPLTWRALILPRENRDSPHSSLISLSEDPPDITSRLFANREHFFWGSAQDFLFTCGACDHRHGPQPAALGGCGGGALEFTQPDPLVWCPREQTRDISDAVEVRVRSWGQFLEYSPPKFISHDITRPFPLGYFCEFLAVLRGSTEPLQGLKNCNPAVASSNEIPIFHLINPKHSFSKEY